MNQQEFLAHLKATKAKAIKTGKITRLSSGQYFYHAENVLYYISKCENELTGSSWSWCVDGNHPQDSYPTYNEAVKALFAHLDHFHPHFM